MSKLLGLTVALTAAVAVHGHGIRRSQDFDGLQSLITSDPPGYLKSRCSKRLRNLIDDEKKRKNPKAALIWCRCNTNGKTIMKPTDCNTPSGGKGGPDGFCQWIPSVGCIPKAMPKAENLPSDASTDPAAVQPDPVDTDELAPENTDPIVPVVPSTPTGTQPCTFTKFWKNVLENDCTEEGKIKNPGAPCEYAAKCASGAGGADASGGVVSDDVTTPSEGDEIETAPTTCASAAADATEPTSVGDENGNSWCSCDLNAGDVVKTEEACLSKSKLCFWSDDLCRTITKEDQCPPKLKEMGPACERPNISKEEAEAASCKKYREECLEEDAPEVQVEIVPEPIPEPPPAPSDPKPAEGFLRLSRVTHWGTMGRGGEKHEGSWMPCEKKPEACLPASKKTFDAWIGTKESPDYKNLVARGTCTTSFGLNMESVAPVSADCKDTVFRGVGVAEMTTTGSVKHVKSVYVTGGMQVIFDTSNPHKKLYCSSLGYKFTVCDLPPGEKYGSLEWGEVEENGGSSSSAPPAPTKIGCTGKVSLFEHGWFDGWEAKFKKGEYDVHAMRRGGAKNDAVSSLKVPKGCKVTLYQHGWFDGQAVEFPSGDYNHGAMTAKGLRNDHASSLKVQDI